MGRYVAAVGGVNVDIGGRSMKPVVKGDSNPGRVSVSLGGVARNIAHNLRALGVPVELCAVLGSDGWADMIEESCRELGIGLGLSLRARGESTSTYLYVAAPSGEMEYAVCDMQIARLLTPDAIKARLDALNRAEIVVIDTNLAAETVEYIAANVRRPIFADPVSTAKCDRLRSVLPMIDTLKPNLIEAKALTGGGSAAECAEIFRSLGVKNVFISEGSSGMTVLSGGEIFTVPAFPCRLVNATGGGDAAMAALVRCRLEGIGARESAEYALAAGAIAVESQETINPQICDKLIKYRIMEAKNEQIS